MSRRLDAPQPPATRRFRVRAATRPSEPTNDGLYARGYHSQCPGRRQAPQMSQCSSFGGSRPYSHPNSTCVPTVKAEKSGKSFTPDQLLSRDRT